MEAGVNQLALRYVVAVGSAYFVFLVLVRIWLAYVGSGGNGYDFTGDALDIGSNVVPDTTAPRFHGSGAKGSWTDALSGGGSGDLDDLVVIVLLVVFVVCLCGFAIYFIYTAPALLSEAAFEAALAASLVRQAKNAAGGWMPSIWRATMWPFLIVLVLSGLLGWVAQKRCPEAKRLRDAISCVPAGKPPATAGRSL